MSATSERPISVDRIDPERSTNPPPTTAPRSGGHTLWPLLARLHFYAGVLVAPFLVVAALTGMAYAVTPQIDSLLYGDKLHVSDATGAVRPIDEQVRAARAAHPEGTVASVQLPAAGNGTTRLVLNVPGLGEENQRTVFVDPYTSQVKGQLTTWYGSTPVTTWLDAMHRNLHLGAVGRYYSELAASWLWIIAGGGLLMWLGRARTYRSGKRRHIVAPNLATAKGVRRTRGWHASTGVWLIVGLFFLSATGLTWSNHAGARFTSALDALHAHAPDLDTALPNTTGNTDAGGHHAAAATSTTKDVDPADIATVLTIARTAGLTGPLDLAAPAEPGTAWSATETDNVWPVHKDAVAIDPAGNEVTARNSWSDYSFVAKLSKLGIQAHMGILFGPVNEILLVALALGLVCVIFWGYRMWWQRRPTRNGQSRPFGTPPARGTWRRLPSLAVVLGLAVTVALCWALPVFGWSLVIFLLADLYLAEVHRQRDAATREITPGRADGGTDW
jgi:uncharacterized iron-regulated membrane protein